MGNRLDSKRPNSILQFLASELLEQAAAILQNGASHSFVQWVMCHT
jgi:hypothetical protein